MRLLLLNPNTTQSVTDRLYAVAREGAHPTTEIVPLTAARGVPYIMSSAEALIAGSVVLEMLAEQHSLFDAVIIAAFGDPGLGAARELFPLPVIGLAEAGMLSACMLGRRFSVISFSRGFEPWYRDCVDWHGLNARCASIRGLPTSFTSLDSVQSECGVELTKLARRTIADDGADVIVLGGAPLAGLATSLRPHLPVPVIDCVSAAVKQAEAVVSLRGGGAISGSGVARDPKASSGLPAALASWLAGGHGDHT